VFLDEGKWSTTHLVRLDESQHAASPLSHATEPISLSLSLVIELRLPPVWHVLIIASKASESASSVSWGSVVAGQSGRPSR